jgi:hypothetical protein
LQENVVNKKRELLPDLSPTFPCLFALPLLVTFPPRIAAEKKIVKSRRFVQKYKSASLSIRIVVQTTKKFKTS